MAIATAYGASKMMHINSEVPPGQLRRNVTSPNGTTQKAIEKFEELDLHNIINQAVISCKIRAEELTTQLNNI